MPRDHRRQHSVALVPHGLRLYAESMPLPPMKLFDRLDAIPPLSEEERQVLDSVRALAHDKIGPARRGIRPHRRVSLGQCPRHQRAWPQRRLRPRSLRRRRSLLCRLSCLRAGNIEGLCFDRHHLGDQFPRDEAADRLRQRGAEGAAPAPPRRWRVGGARDHRARGRLRRHPYEDALHARWRRHRRLRRQDLHHQRRCRRSDPALRQMGGRGRRPQGDLGIDPGEGRPRPRNSAHRGQDGPPRLLDRGARL